MVCLTRIPDSLAMVRSWAVACIILPKRVREKKRCMVTIIRMVMKTIKTYWGEIRSPPTCSMVFPKGFGVGSGSGPQMFMAKFGRKMEAPMVPIRGIIQCLSRRG